MLSSTWSDLIEYRERVLDALDRIRLIGLPVEWVGMEAFSASSRHNVRTEVLRRVAECDLYVGVLGHRYGTLSREDGISFVELEYECAMKLGLPRLLFVMAEGTASSAGAPDDAPRLHALRQRFRDDRLVGIFTSPDNLGLQVAIALLPDLLAARFESTNSLRAAVIRAPLGAAASIALTASPATISADGVSTSTITATVTDASGNAVDGEAIVWSVAGFGTVNPVNTRTAGGRVTVTVTPLHSITGGRIVASCVAASSGAGASIALDLMPGA